MRRCAAGKSGTFVPLPTGADLDQGGDRGLEPVVAALARLRPRVRSRRASATFDATQSCDWRIDVLRLELAPGLTIVEAQGAADGEYSWIDSFTMISDVPF